MYMKLAILAAFAFLYSLVAGRIERTRITGPMVFIAFGFLVGPLGTGWLKLDITSQGLRILADLTLSLVLFIDAANADISVLETSTLIPRRMLLFGLPGAIALGFVAGLLDVSVYERNIAGFNAKLEAFAGQLKRIKETLSIDIPFSRSLFWWSLYPTSFWIATFSMNPT